jgi:hypothetical protein
MKKKIVSLLLTFCFFCISAQTKLSFNPEKGAKYEFVVETTQSTKQNVMGQDISMEAVTNGIFLMEIKNKTPQEIHVQMTYQKFTSAISSPMMNVSYDSKKTTDNPSEIDRTFEKVFSALFDKPFTIVFTPNGSVKSVTGMDAIMKSMLDAISTEGQMAMQMASQMTQQFSDESMKNMFGESFFAYPDNALKVGDSWNTDLMMPISGVNIDVKTKNTLKEVRNNQATIDVVGDITMEMDPSMGMGEGKFTGAHTGTTLIDTTTGMPITGTISQDIKGSISMQGMTLQMEMTSKTKTTAKRLN